MSFNPFTVIKSLLIKKEGVLTPDSVEIIPGSSDTSTKVTITQTNTVDINLTLPLEGGIVLTDTGAATLSNKSIDADDNTITNIDNADIKVGAAIDAAKIHDGSVSNTEFGYLDGVTSSIQTQLNNNATAISDHIADSVGAHAASAISNTPSGNLVATDVQGALNEIQTELDAVVIVANDAATKELDNLTTTALNVDLLPDADGTRDLGSSTLEFAETHSKSLNRTTAGNLTISVASGNLTLSPSGDIDANNNSIVNVPNPTAGSHAANKEYVDSLAAGFDPKAAVRVASTADVGGSYATTPSNGRLTGAATSVDGISLTIGDRVLLKDQTDLKQNGIYEYTASGEFTRAADSDGSPAAEVSSGNFTFATQGTLNSASGFVLLGNGILTLNVDNLDWTQSSGGASGASRFLDNLLSPVAINQDLLPNASNTINLGSTSLPYASSNTVISNVNDGSGTTRISMASSSSIATIDSTATTSLSIRQQTAGATLNATTANNGSGVSGNISATTGTGTTDTGNISLNTGNGTDSSGDISLQTGTGTTRGDVTLNARSTQVTSGAFNLTQGQVAIPIASQHSLSINGGGSDEGLFKTTSSDSAIRTILTSGPEGLSQAQNLIINGDAEGKLTSSTSIFIPYADAAGPAPVDGSGGSPNVTSAIVTTGALAGSKSYTLVKDAANRQGQGWAIEFNVNPANRGRVQSIKFDYIVNSGIFTAGTSTTNSDVTVWIYDVSNSVLIQPSSFKLLSNSLTIADQFQAEFQTSTTGTTYRLIYHISTTSVNNYTLIVDNIVVSPSEYVFGTPISDWQNFPSVAAGTLIKAVTTNPTYGTIQTNKAQYRRNGDSLDIRWDFVQTTAGGAGSGDYLFDISQLGLTIDTTKVEANTASTTVQSMTSASIGKVTFRDSSNAAVGYASVYNSTQIKAFGIFTPGNSNGPWTAAGLGRFSLTPLSISLEAKVPIAGWSSSVQQADQTSTRVVAAQYSRTSASAIGSGTAFIFDTLINDTHAAFSTITGRYTAPVSGYYRFAFSAYGGGGGNVDLNWFKNGTILQHGATSLTTAVAHGTTTIFLNTGEFVELRPAAGFNPTAGGGGTVASTNYLTVERISGPSQIASSETVACRVFGDPPAITGTNPVIPPSVDYDTHGMYNVTTGQFTVPISGIYRVDGASEGLGTTGIGFFLRKNGTSQMFMGSTDNFAGTATFHGITTFVAGDIITVTPNTSVNPTSTWIAVTRIGNRG